MDTPRENDALDITPLQNATAALGRSLALYKQYTPNDAALYETLRSGVIQNFEVTFELSWKFMKRWLSINRSPDILMGIPMKELFRHAAENRLIDSAAPWFGFHDSRNLTTHTYNEDTAEKAALLSEAFLPLAQDLLSRLERSHDLHGGK